MSTLRFGWHMPSFPVDGSSGPRFVEQVRASLDRLHPHFESVWVDDHLWPWAGWQPADTPFLECVSTIAHFATVYRDLTFGSFVFCQNLPERADRRPDRQIGSAACKRTQACFTCSVRCRVAGQASAVSKAVMLRLARLNSTPMRWMGAPAARYLSA